MLGELFGARGVLSKAKGGSKRRVEGGSRFKQGWGVQEYARRKSDE